MREFDKRSRHFLFGNHFVDSHNRISWQCTDIVRRKLLLVTIETWRVNYQSICACLYFLERAYSRSWDGSVQAHCRRRFGHQKGGACLVGWYPYEVRSPVKEIYIRFFFSFNQAAFECMYTLLDTCLDRLDIFEFLSHVEDGLKDHYDIKVREISWLNCLILDFAVSVSYEDISFYA